MWRHLVWSGEVLRLPSRLLKHCWVLASSLSSMEPPSCSPVLLTRLATSSHSSGDPNYRAIAPPTPQSARVIIQGNRVRPSQWGEWGGDRPGESFFAPAITANLSTKGSGNNLLDWGAAAQNAARYGVCNPFKSFWVKRWKRGAWLSMGCQLLHPWNSFGIYVSLLSIEFLKYKSICWCTCTSELYQSSPMYGNVPNCWRCFCIFLHLIYIST